MTLYREDVLPNEPNEREDERNDLERDRDTLSDLYTAAVSARDAIYRLDTEANGLVLDDVELSEDEATSELTSQVTTLAELIRDVESAIEYLQAQANDRLGKLDELESAYVNEE